MNEFKSGTIDEILEESVIYKNGKLTSPGSFYVQVTYYDINGKHVEDAVMTFTGNARSVRGGRGTFSLTRADGTRIDESLLTNPDDPFADELNESIKVYNVPENDYGTATVSGLKSFGTTKVTSDSNSKVTMKEVLNESYDINDSTILYEEYLDTSNSSLFSTFVESSGSGSDSIISTIKEIDSVLLGTNSEVFSTGKKAQSELKKIYNLNENTQVFKNRLGNLDTGELSNTINKFNEKLTKLKKETRTNLLEKRIDEINSQNILYDERTETLYEEGSDTVYYWDSRFRIEETYRAKLFGAYKKTTKKYIYLQNEKGDSIERLENLIESVGRNLPYDKSKIIEE